MAVRQVMVCDIDGNEPAQRYQITYPDGTVWEVELCSKPHDTRIQQFRDEGIGREAARGRKRKVFHVTQVEDIGHEKSTKKTTPAKKTAPKKRS